MIMVMMTMISMFLTFHSIEAAKMLEKYKIGSLKDSRHYNNQNQQIAKTPKFTSLLRYKQKQIMVSKIFLYPIKGCGGIEVQSAVLTPNGFVNDRIYAFVNSRTKKIINQLKYPKLSMIRVNDITPDGITINNKFVPVISDKILTIQWKSSVFEAYDQGTEIASWITEYIDESNEKFIFVRIKEDHYRETGDYFALTFVPKSKQLISGFQNYAQILLSSEESLNELNKRYKKKQKLNLCKDDDEKEIKWDRFRMNIILSGMPQPHYEDFMKRISFGPKNSCGNPEILWSRRRYFCCVPTINQNTGKAVSSQEPLNTAQRYRNAITLNDRTSLPRDKAIFFGSFYCIKKTGNIYVGQRVNSEYEQLNYTTTRTNFGKSYYGLTSFNFGSNLALDYYYQYQEFKLIKKEKYNHNTIKFRFMVAKHWEKKYHISLKQSLKMGDHYLLKYIDNNKNMIIRAYTPLFDHFDVDNTNNMNNMNEMCFDLLVKIYKNGRMTSHLNNMKINDIILGKQNYGKICYYEINYIRFGDPRHTMYMSYNLNVNQMNLICAGSGITPIYQIIINIHLNRNIDNTKLSVIYCNKTINDILLKKKLEIINKINKNIKIHFVLSSKNYIINDDDDDDNNISIDCGTRINKKILTKYLFPPNIKCVSLLSAPFKMEKTVRNMLNEMGYEKKSIANF